MPATKQLSSQLLPPTVGARFTQISRWEPALAPRALRASLITGAVRAEGKKKRGRERKRERWVARERARGRKRELERGVRDMQLVLEDPLGDNVD